jgi:hypothetical protein
MTLSIKPIIKKNTYFIFFLLTVTLSSYGQELNLPVFYADNPFLCFHLLTQVLTTLGLRRVT